MLLLARGNQAGALNYSEPYVDSLGLEWGSVLLQASTYYWHMGWGKKKTVLWNEKSLENILSKNLHMQYLTRKKKYMLENSKVTSLRKPEVQGFTVLTSKLASIKQNKCLFDNFYLQNILLGSNGKQRHACHHGTWVNLEQIILKWKVTETQGNRTK